MDVGDYGVGTNLLTLCRENVILDTNIVARSLAYGQELDYIVKKRYSGGVVSLKTLALAVSNLTLY